MAIVIGSDHAAFEEKEMIERYLISKGIEVIDVGPDSADRCDYPDFAMKLSRTVVAENGRGVLLCGSGIGVSMVANRFKGIRAALCRTAHEAKLSRQHNDANVLCLGARISSEQELQGMIDAWLEAEFEDGRHTGRVAKFNDIGIE
ncbi:MAG: ribose 5-phosphate isomerase B [Bacteriovoracaceae bacterium]|nr:ribose 5-phosphate isomerase B [Bacteriovoracaceae bacterium]